MVHLLAFDSKDFLRRKLYQEEDPETKEPFLAEESAFYTPLGVGVEFNDTAAFKDVCAKKSSRASYPIQINAKTTAV